MFTLSVSGKSTILLIDSKDYQGVIRTLYDLKTDTAKVSQSVPNIVFNTIPNENEFVIAGTLG